MNDYPDYDIAEFLLAGLFIAASLASLVWAAASLHERELPSAAEGFGLCLMFLGGSVHPKKHVLDCVTFPFTFTNKTGRETRITVLAANLGFLLWLGGLAANHLG